MKPHNLISALRKTDLYIEQIFLNGGCYQFSEFLITLFPSGETHIDADKGHVVTKINNTFYDITGEVKGEYFPLTEEDKVMCERWSFSKNYWLYRECPNCEEQVFADAQS